MALSAIATLTRYPISLPSSFLPHISRFVLVKHHSRKHRLMTMAYTSSTDEKITAPYGSWKSPITADFVSGSEKRLGATAVDDLGRLFWLESRPLESGRSVLVKAPEKAGDEPVDITPKEFSVRTVAQEYGGGAFRIVGDTVIFSNYKDQRLYKQSIQSADSSPLPLTPDYGGPLACYADGVFDSRFNRYVTVREDRREDHLNATTTIVSLNLNKHNIQAENICFWCDGFAGYPFGCKISSGSSDCHQNAAEFSPNEFCKPKISHFWVLFRIQQNVFGLNVAVDDAISALVMEVGEFETNFIASRVSNRLRVLVHGSNSDEESLPAES